MESKDTRDEGRGKMETSGWLNEEMELEYDFCKRKAFGLSSGTQERPCKEKSL